MTEMPETPEDDTISTPQQLWQAQEAEGVHMSLEEIHERSRKYQRRLVSAGALATLICIFEIGFFFRLIVTRTEPLEKAGYLLLLMGVFFVFMVILMRLSGLRDVKKASETSVEFYRTALKRGISHRRTAWALRGLPILPGLCVILYQAYRHAALSTNGAVSVVNREHNVILTGALAVAVLAVAFSLALWRSERRVRQLRLELKQLERSGL